MKESLHDPDSAEFDGFNHDYIEKGKDGIYLVQVGLRARNWFNGMRKFTVNCRTMPGNDGYWKVLSLKELN